jgi:hypothetical protein
VKICQKANRHKRRKTDGRGGGPSDLCPFQGFLEIVSPVKSKSA